MEDANERILEMREGPLEDLLLLGWQYRDKCHLNSSRTQQACAELRTQNWGSMERPQESLSHYDRLWNKTKRGAFKCLKPPNNHQIHGFPQWFLWRAQRCLQARISMALRKFNLISLDCICFVHIGEIVQGKSDVRGWMVQRKLPRGSKTFTGGPSFRKGRSKKRECIYFLSKMPQ